MSGGSFSDELKEKLQGFELKQTRERIEVMRLKSKIAAHEAWIDHGSRMAKEAEDGLKQYMEGGVVDDEHRKYLEIVRTDSKHLVHENKSAVIRSIKKLEKIVEDGVKQNEKQEPSPVSYERPSKSPKLRDDKWATNRCTPRVDESFGRTSPNGPRW